LKIIRSNFEKISNLIKTQYENDSELKLDLNRIWNCIPIKGKQGDSGGYEGTSRYLNLLDSIFSGRKTYTQFLISQFNEVIQILKFEKPGYNIKVPDKNANFSNQFHFINKILQLNFLLLFLKNLNLLEGFDVPNTTQINFVLVQDMIPEQILNYWNNVEIYEDEQKKSLFLLGYMMGEIGISQSSQEIKNKPILNKINFQGMSTEKLIRLANEVPEKLKQYRKLNYNENINTAFRILFESNMKNWKLSNQENVFYVLSGYSYSNYLLWKRKKNIKDLFTNKFERVNKLKEEKVNVETYEKLLNEAKDMIFGEFKDYKKAKEILAKIHIDEKEAEI
jgi:CRISPR-associated protein Csh1